MEVASFLLSKENSHSENSQTPTKKVCAPEGLGARGPSVHFAPRHPASPTTTLLCQEHQKAWALNLNGFDVEEAKILRLSGKPQKVPEGKTRASRCLEGGVCLSHLRLRGWGGVLIGLPGEGQGRFRVSRAEPPSTGTGYENRLKVLYSQKATPGSSKRTCRYIPSLPDRILDAPEIRNDYCKRGLHLAGWVGKEGLGTRHTGQHKSLPLPLWQT